jgi:hypothetical protein
MPINFAEKRWFEAIDGQRRINEIVKPASSAARAFLSGSGGTIR